MVFNCVISSRVQRPPRRPRPLRLPLYPPNGVWGCQYAVVSLMFTTPVSSASATRNARPTSRVKTAPTSPVGERLAAATAYASSPNVIVAATGPKVSSCSMSIPGRMSRTTVAS
jgi:hypothetical protein